MLKNAWNKVAVVLPENVREYIEGARYIKMDGTPYHSKGFASIMHRPEVKVGMLATAYCCANQLIFQGNWDITTAGMMNTVTNGLIDTALASVLYRWVIAGDSFTTKFQKAIDREGRDLSRTQPSLQEYKNLKDFKYKNLSWSYIIGAGAFTVAALGAVSSFNPSPEMTQAPQLISPYFAAFLGASLSSTIRAQRLLTGEYCFCDKPPAKRQESKQESHVSGGKMAHQYAPIPVPVKR